MLYRNTHFSSKKFAIMVVVVAVAWTGESQRSKIKLEFVILNATSIPALIN